MKVAVNEFVTRQTPESEFSHFNGSWDELVALVLANFENNRPGYRDGVILVSVPPTQFFTPVVELVEGDKLVGEYVARREGETPRINIRVQREEGKQEARSVDIVLYSHDTLAENNEQSTDAEWEIIAINAFPTEEVDTPINPMTLMHNHFGSDGGTNTNMSPAEFEDALRKSFKYWSNKAIASQ